MKRICAAIAIVAAIGGSIVLAQNDGADAGKASSLKPLEIELPKPAFKGTPKSAPAGTNLEPNRRGAREPLRVPDGVVLLSRGKPVTSSDSEPIIGSLSMVTDGQKEAAEGGYVELGPGSQWVQIDLRQPAQIYAIVVWHYHMSARVYHDVIVQIATEPTFTQKEGLYTVFHNDHDESSGLGVGTDREYWDTFEGKLIDVQAALKRYGAKSAKARYMRLYSRGSTADELNHYTEVEVYGIPASP